MKIHENYIRKCIEIAKNGIGPAAPNPSVGCVIVHNDNIIGQGYTSAYGGNHAEVNAIASVKDKSVLNKSTLYVTLEPCSHHGKTPPCTNLIIEHKIPHLVIGCVDDNPEVAGKGIEKLRSAGCKVTIGIQEAHCKTHHRRFFTYHNQKRPYIILKWAQTVDGFIAPKTKSKKRPVWITNPYSRQLVHKWRTEEQAILVGTNTVLEDNPTLTSRNWFGKQPLRLVIDRGEKLPKNLNIFNDHADTLVISAKTVNFDLPIAKQICDVLYGKKISSIIVEGGLKTLQTFIDEDLWDEARIFTGTTQFKDGVRAPQLLGKLVSEETVDDDILKIFQNKN